MIGCRQTGIMLRRSYIGETKKNGVTHVLFSVELLDDENLYTMVYTNQFKGKLPGKNTIISFVKDKDVLKNVYTHRLNLNKNGTQ